MLTRTGVSKYYAALAALAVLGLSACSAPSARPGSVPPAWVSQPARAVDAGYIVYVGSGEDYTLATAQFKAEAMALQDLANECSFAPKGARIEDRYVEAVGSIHRAYVKLGVDLEACEAAKAAVTPEKIRVLANPQLTAEIKRYQDLIDQPEEDETAELDDSTEAAPTADTQPAGTPASMAVRDQTGYFVVRQRVAFVKQEVILAPAETYAPQAPASAAPIPGVTAAKASLHGYESAHPEIKAPGAPAFSGARPNSQAHRPAVLGGRGPRAGSVRPRPRARRPSRPPGSGKAHPRERRRRRRRRAQ